MPCLHGRSQILNKTMGQQLRTYLFGIACLLSTFNCFGQRGFEAVGFYGISHYKGDLQPLDFEPLETHPAAGGMLKYCFDNRFSVRAHYVQGMISGTDANFSTIESLRMRNLGFRSTIHEIGLGLEAMVIGFGGKPHPGGERMVRHFFSMYVFGGMAGTKFNPQALYEGRWVDLQPLRTEGQSPYRRTALALPYGFGLKLNLTKWSAVGFELGFRKVFSDYLDDVSGSYPDIALLRKNNPMAAALSYRTPEVNGDLTTNPLGNKRGDESGTDSYLFAGVSLIIFISE